MAEQVGLALFFGPEPSGHGLRRRVFVVDAVDDLIELKTICQCGRKATMNLRVDREGCAVKEGAQVEIGGNDRYLAMCRRHFKEALAGMAITPQSTPSRHSVSPFSRPG